MTVAHIVANLKTLTLPADDYVFVFSAEGTLVGTRSGFLNGLIPTALSFGDDDVSESFRRLFEEIDTPLPKPIDEEMQFIEYNGHKIAFLPFSGMGNNHAGWFEGFFMLPSAFYRELEELATHAGYNLDPDRMIVHFDADATVSVDPSNLHEDNLVFGYRFNDKSLTESNVVFTGSVEMI